MPGARIEAVALRSSSICLIGSRRATVPTFGGPERGIRSTLRGSSTPGYTTVVSTPVAFATASDVARTASTPRAKRPSGIARPSPEWVPWKCTNRQLPESRLSQRGDLPQACAWRRAGKLSKEIGENGTRRRGPLRLQMAVPSLRDTELDQRFSEGPVLPCRNHAAVRKRSGSSCRASAATMRTCAFPYSLAEESRWTTVFGLSGGTLTARPGGCVNRRMGRGSPRPTV